MGKEKLYIDNKVFRAYFGKCFDEILLGDRPYSLKQETKIEKQKKLHTIRNTRTVENPETKERKSVHTLQGYYTEEDTPVKTGKLTAEQKQLLKQQFLQLAYDSIAKNYNFNKIYVDLMHVGNNVAQSPIEYEYKKIQEEGNVVVENDDPDSEFHKYWEEIEESEDAYNEYGLKADQIDLYASDGTKLSDYEKIRYSIVPNYSYKTKVASALKLNWKSIKSYTYNISNTLDIDDYFTVLKNAVLEKFEPEDRKIIENELPDFGVTQEDKDLFLERNQELHDHYNALNPLLSGNRYIEKIFPNAVKDIMSNPRNLLEKYFKNTIFSKEQKDIEENYAKDLKNFVNRLLNPQEDKYYVEDINIKKLRYIFKIEPRDIQTLDDVKEFEKLLHDKIVPSLVVAEEYNSYEFDKKYKPLTSFNLNMMIAKKDLPLEVKEEIGAAAKIESKKAENLKVLYDEIIAPNIKNGSLDMEKMQKAWLDLSKKMGEPANDKDKGATKIIKNFKDGYKSLTDYNGEVKNKNEEFKATETKIEWRNEETYRLLNEAINYYAPSSVKEQISNTLRFNMKNDAYVKESLKSMKDSEIAADSLNRIQGLIDRPSKNNVLNPYRLLSKDDQNFPVVDDDTKQDYLKRCCAEINSLQKSYDNRSFWYHIAFWKNKPEKEAIKAIKASLTRNGFSKEQINTSLTTFKDELTDGAFNYNINNHIIDEPNDVLSNQIEVNQFMPEVEESELEFKQAKKLTKQVLPRYGTKVIDPVLGNVSEMYGPILNEEKNELFKDEYLLSQHAKNKLEINPEKEITEKDVEEWIDPNKTSSEPMSQEELDLLEEYRKLSDDIDDFDEDLEEDEEEKDIDNSEEKEEQKAEKEIVEGKEL